MINHRVYGLLLVLASLLLTACGSRSQEAPATTEVPCVKAAGGAKVELHASRGGEGEVRGELPAKTKIAVLRTMDGWSLVRVAGSRAMGWLPEGQVGRCKASEAKAAPRAARKRAVEARGEKQPPARPASPTSPADAAPAAAALSGDAASD